MKTITYYFVDGTTENVEVSDQFATVYKEREHAEHLSDRRNTRRHSSLEQMMEAGFDFPSDNEELEELYNREVNNPKLIEAMKELTEEQKKLLYKIYVQGYRAKDVAESEGVNQNAITLRLGRILRKMRKFFITPTHFASSRGYIV